MTSGIPHELIKKVRINKFNKMGCRNSRSTNVENSTVRIDNPPRTQNQSTSNSKNVEEKKTSKSEKNKMNETKDRDVSKVEQSNENMSLCIRQNIILFLKNHINRLFNDLQ